MKRNAIVKLVKDLIIVAILGGIGALMAFSDTSIAFGLQVFLTLAIGGLPFGWRWASKIITATSLKGIAIKALISALLGSVAIFFVLASDIIRCFVARE
jgi:hypothetical protein